MASPVTSILPFMGSEGVSHDLPIGKKQNLGTGCRILWTSHSKRPNPAVAYWKIFVDLQILSHWGISQHRLKISHLLSITFKKTSPPGLYNPHLHASQENVNFICYQSVYSVIQPVWKSQNLGFCSYLYFFFSFPESFISFSCENGRCLVNGDVLSIMPYNDSFLWNELLMKVPGTQSSRKIWPLLVLRS